MALLAVLDDHGIEVFLPRCGLIEIAAVSTRLANPSASEKIWNEVETSFTIVPEDRLIEYAKKLQSTKAARVLIHVFLLSPNRIQFLSLRMIWECTAPVNEGQFCSWLLRDIDLKSVIPDLK